MLVLLHLTILILVIADIIFPSINVYSIKVANLQNDALKRPSMSNCDST